MTLKVKIKLADNTKKEFTMNTTIELPIGLSLAPVQVVILLNTLSALWTLMKDESWKSVETEIE